MSRTVSVQLQAVTDAYRREMDRAKGSTVGLAREVKAANVDLGKLGATLTRSVSLPLGVAGVAAAKLSLDFDRTFGQMQGLAGVAAKDVDGLKEAVLGLAGETGRAPQELAQGLYFVRSAGIDGATALDALEVSAKGATAGLGSTAAVADAITSALSAYGAASLTAAEAGDVLAATAREGKAEAAQLAPQFGRLLPVAAELGIEFNEVGAGLAFLSRSSGSAELSATQLSGVMAKMLKPTQQGADLLKEYGTSAAEIRSVVADQGLLPALELLKESFGGNQEALAKYFDDVQGLQGALLLTGRNADEARGVFDALEASTGALAFGFDAAANRDGFALQQAFAEIQAAAISLGDAAGPAIASIAGGVADLAGAFAVLPDSVNTALLVLGGMAVATGPILSVVGSVQKLRTNLDGLGPSGAQAGKALGALGKIGGYAGAIAGTGFALSVLHGELTKVFQADAPDVDEMGLALIQLGQDAVTSGALLDAFGDDLSGLGDDLALLQDRRSGFSLDFAEDFDEAVDRIDSVDKALAQLVDTGNGDLAARVLDDLTASFAGTGVTSEQLTAELGDYEDALVRAEAQQRLTGAGADDFTTATDTLAASVADAEAELDALTAALEDLLAGSFSVTEASDALTSQILDLTDRIGAAREAGDGWSATLDGDSRAAVDNRAAVMDLVGGVAALVEAQARQGASSEEIQATLGQQKARLEETLLAYGFTREEIGTYLAVIDQIPAAVSTMVTVTGAENARSLIEGIAGAMARLQGAGIDVAVNAVGALGVRPFAEGGMLPSDARIQPPGTLVQWAEPSTGGEAYLPLQHPGGRMTLIAVHAAHDHAHVLTDTLAYTGTQRRLWRSSKALVLPHLDAAVMCHGSAEFGTYWAVHASLLARATSFDQLTDDAPEVLAGLWHEVNEMNDHRNAIHGARSVVPRSAALAVGYSERAGRFRALVFSSEDAFQPVDLDGLWVVPSPLTVRPSDFELDRLERTFETMFGDASAVTALRGLPAPIPPSTEAGWTFLARTVRWHRALVDLYSGLKMYVGGDAILTRLERGSSTTRKVYTFDDTGEEFTRMMAGSLHPAGQLGACRCGSGAPLVGCCLRSIFDDACPCGSGRTFTDCCRVDVPDHPTACAV